MMVDNKKSHRPYKVMFWVVAMIFLMFTVNAVSPPNSLIQLGTAFILADDETADTAYNTIGIGIFNLSIDSDIAADISFTGERLTGTATPKDYEWRLLIDDIEISNLTRSLENGEQTAVYMKGIVLNQTQGIHNITLQHRVSQNSLATKNIDVVIRNYFTVNSTEINHAVKNFTGISTGQAEQDIFNTTFTSVQSEGVLITFLYGQISSTGANEIITHIEIDGIESGDYTKFISSATDTSFFVQLFRLNISDGVHNISVVQSNRDVGDTSTFLGNLEIIERKQLNDKSSEINILSEAGIPNDGLFHAIMNHTINITVINNSLVAAATTQTIKTGSGKRTIDFMITLDNTINSSLSSTELDGSTDRIISGMIKNSFNSISSGIHNLTLFARMETGLTQILTLRNTTLVLFQLVPFDTVIEKFDNFPEVTLIAPPNDSLFTFVANESHGINFLCFAEDDNNLSNITLYMNKTGTFESNATQLFNGTSGTLNITIDATDISETIAWNCLAFDNASQSAYATDNWTFSESHISHNLTVDLIAPENNSNTSIFSGGDVFFTFATNLFSNCSHVINDTIIDTHFNVNDTTTVSHDIFTENQSVTWYMNCTINGFNTVSDEWIMNIIIVPPLESYLTVDECKTDIGSVILLIFFIFVSFIVIWIGIQYRVGMVGVFGSLLLLFVSYYIVPCLIVFGRLMLFFSLFLIVFFFFRRNPEKF